LETRAPRGNAQKKTPPAEADGGTNYEKMNVVVRDSMIGYVFKEKTRLRKTNDRGAVLMLPPRLSGDPPTPSSVHKILKSVDVN
jgi:hypothetical protein